MKLDVNVLRYLSKDEFRVLTAVEMGQKNVSNRCSAAGLGSAARSAAQLQSCYLCHCLCSQHEIVPMPLIDSISGLK